MITDQQMLGLFEKFQSLRRATADSSVRAKILPPDDFVLPNSYPIEAFLFGQMASDFTRGLIGEVNRFLVGIQHADCWVRVAEELEEDDKVVLLWEFADPLLELSVNRPHSLRDHFSYAMVHLLHQGNCLRFVSGNEELGLDQNIDYRYLKKQRITLGKNWATFPAFLEALDGLNDSSFVKRTNNFRNLVQHRFRLRFHSGITTFFERDRVEGGMRYTYTTVVPLQPAKLIPELYAQHDKATSAFKAYWQILSEMCSHVGAAKA